MSKPRPAQPERLMGKVLVTILATGNCINIEYIKTGTGEAAPCIPHSVWGIIRTLRY